MSRIALFIVAAALCVYAASTWAIHDVSIAVPTNTATDVECVAVRAKQAALPTINEVEATAYGPVTLNAFFAPGADITSPVCGAISPTYATTNDSVAVGLTLDQSTPSTANYYSSSLVQTTAGTIGMKATNSLDATGKTLTAPADVVAAPGGTLIKWNPGTYADTYNVERPSLGIASSDATILSIAGTNFKGMKFQFPWGELESTQGVYDFSLIRH
ncbi:MAG: hypothetical protein E4H01_14410, partial [Lysobacterales bacterium]